jgi:hypothetical protein
VHGCASPDEQFSKTLHSDSIGLELFSKNICPIRHGAVNVVDLCAGINHCTSYCGLLICCMRANVCEQNFGLKIFCQCVVSGLRVLASSPINRIGNPRARVTLIYCRTRTYVHVHFEKHVD